jgi:hypothetical protein
MLSNLVDITSWSFGFHARGNKTFKIRCCTELHDSERKQLVAISRRNDGYYTIKMYDNQGR